VLAIAHNAGYPWVTDVQEYHTMMRLSSEVLVPEECTASTPLIEDRPILFTIEQSKVQPFGLCANKALSNDEIVKHLKDSTKLQELFRDLHSQRAILATEY